ncbi:hypothetical protein RB195_013557 [Necator americanus]|uniref:Uncharacterized protein n=1 Tax=Necator americanus TaxID=51031 RepID=A0ABR1DW31_NECAM
MRDDNKIRKKIIAQHMVTDSTAGVGGVGAPAGNVRSFFSNSGGHILMGRSATVALPLVVAVVASLSIECPATTVLHHCRHRTVRCDVRWGWAREEKRIFAPNVQHLKSQVWSPWLEVQNSWPSVGEHRRGSGRISLTTLERPSKTAKLDLIAGILLIFVIDMLLLSFTF